MKQVLKKEKTSVNMNVIIVFIAVVNQVKPFSKDDEELDVWIHKKKPIHLEPWQEGRLTSSSSCFVFP